MSSRRLRPGVTYANVTATLALFISLGGASYAAGVLPVGSVGPTQLQPGAVTPRALGFPLGAAAYEDERSEAIGRNGCDGGGSLKPGEAAPDCAPASLEGPAKLHFRLRAAGTVLISAVVGASNEPTSSPVRLELHLLVDGRVVRLRLATVGAGEEAQIPLQDSIHLAAGAHTVTLAPEIDYRGEASGVVDLGPVSLIATLLPG